jgi:hypothetical protein
MIYKKPGVFLINKPESYSSLRSDYNLIIGTIFDGGDVLITLFTLAINLTTMRRRGRHARINDSDTR